MPEENDKDSKNFLRLGRSLYVDFIEGRISLEEFGMLICLQCRANPHDGRVRTGYAELVDEFRGRFPKNFLTRLLNRLKKKKYLYFKRRQGKSGLFLVYLNNYPLSNRRFTNIEKMFLEEFPLKGLEGEERQLAEAKAELLVDWHNFKEDMEAVAKDYYDSPQYARGSINNDNDNKNENQKSFQLGGNQTDTTQSESDTVEYEKKRCEEIAIALNEPTPSLVQAYCAKYGIDIVEEGYERTIEANKNGVIRNPGAFFNSIVRKLGEEELRRESGELP